MCGIAGLIDTNGVKEEQIRSMLASIWHRGPDGQGLMVRDAVGFGHRRLSIIDLASGQQPMTNDDRNVWITFNGEIYNYRELRNRLQDKYYFRTASDTEVILRLYEAYDIACLQLLRGMFGFAIYDFRNNTLFAARDHLGQKPLFYNFRAHGIAFSSEIKALLALDPSLRELDQEALYEYLSIRIVTPPRSMFKRIRKLPPAHYLIFQNGKLTVKPYWSLNYREKLPRDLGAVVEELDGQVADAVKYHLISDVPIGAYLSGGVDSGLVVANIAKFAKPGFDTFTGNVDYDSYSEMPLAKMVSERYKTTNHELKFMPSLVHDLPDVLWHLDEPSDPLSVAMYNIAKLARQHVKVILGGDGGDELFGGYDRYYGNQYARFLQVLPRFIRKTVIDRLIRLLPEGKWYRSVFHQLKWLNNISLYNGADRYAKSLGYFYFSDTYRDTLYTGGFKREVRAFDPEASIKHYFNVSNADQIVDKMLYTDSMIRMPDHPVMVLDRMTMAHGLEARSPFLDHKLAEFCAKIPPDFKVRGRTRRYIQIELAKRYLPKEVICNKKQGFASAIPYMLESEFQRFFNVFLKHPRLAQEDLLNNAVIEQIIKEHGSGKRDHGQRLWLLASAEMWYRMHIDGISKEQMSADLVLFEP